MATKPDNVKYSSPDGGQTKYLENQRVANDLKAKGVKATAGKASGDRSKRAAKGKEYVARKKSTPAKRSTVAGNTGAVPLAQTFAQNGQQRPQGQYGPMQGPMGQGGQYGQQAPPMQRGAPAQPQYNPLPTYNMQRGAPPQPQYNPLPNYNTQSRPSVFSDPGVQTAIQGMQPQQPTGQAYINQFLQQQQPQIMQQQFNPWRRRW